GWRWRWHRPRHRRRTPGSRFRGGAGAGPPRRGRRAGPAAAPDPGPAPRAVAGPIRLAGTSGRPDPPRRNAAAWAAGRRRAHPRAARDPFGCGVPRPSLGTGRRRWSPPRGLPLPSWAYAILGPETTEVRGVAAGGGIHNGPAARFPVS